MAETPAPRHSIARKVALTLFLALLMLTALGGIAYRSTREFIKTASMVAHSREIIGRKQALMRHLTEAQSGNGDSLDVMVRAASTTPLTGDAVTGPTLQMPPRTVVILR